ncbi:thioredoxin family protein [bacterium]|nr:thioredoxin family protein [bacterium]
MDVTVFGKQGCATCVTTKNKITQYIQNKKLQGKIIFTYCDMDTIDGLSEGAMNDVMSVPTTIFKKDGKVVARWDGNIPETEEYEKLI